MNGRSLTRNFPIAASRWRSIIWVRVPAVWSRGTATGLAYRDKWNSASESACAGKRIFPARLAVARRTGYLPGVMNRAVLFDFDGVLVDTEWSIYQSWRRVFEAHGHELPLAIYTRCIGSDFATWSPKTHLADCVAEF